MDPIFMWDTLQRLLPGIPLMLQLVSLSLAVGFVLAVLVALARLSAFRPLSAAAAGYVFFFRGTPLLVQIFLIYYGLGQFPEIRDSFLWPFLRQPYWCAILAFTLNTGAYGSEIMRGGIQSVPWGQIEAARVCGMSGLLLMRRIILPIAVRQALPAYGNEMILMVKATSLASIITLMEVTGIAQKIIAETYRAVEVFVVAGSIYLLINFVLTRGVRALEWYLSPHLRDARQAAPATEAAALAH
ncbi:MAG: ABC transporter permease [Alphaproteobacteria bacterium]|nr:ABC transporter permease [Alphaproteobacteria bacterium]